MRGQIERRLRMSRGKDEIRCGLPIKVSQAVFPNGTRRESNPRDIPARHMHDIRAWRSLSTAGSTTKRTANECVEPADFAFQ